MKIESDSNPVISPNIQLQPITLPNGQPLQISALVQLAKLAGDQILKIYHSDFSVEYKSDSSPLTKADQAANQVICDFLEQEFPHILIISEENNEVPFLERSKQDLVWLVDPLDGTKEFVKKNGQFTVNIGLAHQKKPYLGIVHVPVSSLTYFAAPNLGAFKYDHNTNVLEPIQVNSYSLTDPNLRLVASASHLNEETSNFIQQFKNPTTLSAGSSLKLLLVAEGAADIYPRLAPTSEWDTCAAHAILRHAGGRCMQANSESEIVYNKESLRNPYFVCYGKLTDQQI